MPPIGQSSKMTSPGRKPVHPCATKSGRRCSSLGWAFRPWGASASHSLRRRRRSSRARVGEVAVSLSQSTNAASSGAPSPGGAGLPKLLKPWVAWCFVVRACVAGRGGTKTGLSVLVVGSRFVRTSPGFVGGFRRAGVKTHKTCCGYFVGPRRFPVGRVNMRLRLTQCTSFSVEDTREIRPDIVKTAPPHSRYCGAKPRASVGMGINLPPYKSRLVVSVRWGSVACVQANGGEAASFSSCQPSAPPKPKGTTIFSPPQG